MSIVLKDYYIEIGFGYLIFLLVSFIVLFVINIFLIKKALKNEHK